MATELRFVGEEGRYIPGIPATDFVMAATDEERAELIEAGRPGWQVLVGDQFSAAVLVAGGLYTCTDRGVKQAAKQIQADRDREAAGTVPAPAEEPAEEPVAEPSADAPADEGE